MKTGSLLTVEDHMLTIKYMSTKDEVRKISTPLTLLNRVGTTRKQLLKEICILLPKERT